MSSNRNKLVSLTDYKTGAVFQLSSCQIISFQQIGANDTSICYIDQRGKIQFDKRVLETVSAIATACISNSIGIMQPITLVTGVVLYLNIDRIIYVDNLTASSPLVTAVTYDAGVLQPAVYKCSTPTASALTALTDNVFAITTVPKGKIPSKTRYINNEKINVVTGINPTPPIITFTTKVKTATGVVSVAGSGYTNPTATITGGGGAGAAGTLTTKVLTATVVSGGAGGTPGLTTFTGTTGTGTKFTATGTINGGGVLTGALTVVIAGNYTVPITNIAIEPITGGSLTGATVSVSLGVLAFTITSSGTGYTSYPTFTVVDSTGTGSTITAQMQVESPLTIVDGGKNVDSSVTLTFSSGTVTATATATVSSSTQSVTSTTLTNAGGYLNGTDAYPTLSISGGTGASIFYDEHKTEFKKIQVEETVATIVSAVNAL